MAEGRVLRGEADLVPSRGTGSLKFQRPPPSSSDPGTNSAAARQSVVAGAHIACGSGRMKRNRP